MAQAGLGQTLGLGFQQQGLWAESAPAWAKRGLWPWKLSSCSV